MTAADLKRRAAMLVKLRDTLAAPLPDKPRRTLAKPQPYQLSPGEVIGFRVDHQGNVRNPYDTKDSLEFEPAGWNTAVVLAVGREFDYLAWYHVAVPSVIRTAPPSLDDAVADFNPAPRYAGCGTLSASHKRRMDLQTLGTIDVPKHRAPRRDRRLDAVASDISIANILDLWDHVERRL